MKKSGIILEDKEIFDVNKTHRNLLRPAPKETCIKVANEIEIDIFARLKKGLSS